MNLLVRLDQLLTVRSTDPDEARQRRMINLLVFLVGGIIVSQISIIIVLDIAGLPLPVPLDEPRYRVQGYVGSAIGVALCAIIYMVNKRSGWLAGVMLTLVIAAAIFGNTPNDLTIATMTFALSASVLCAALFVHPMAGFVMAAVGTGIIALAGMIMGVGFYVASAFDLFAIAVGCWLSARSLQRALADLRSLNVELDQRVQERTQDLSELLGQYRAILDSTTDGILVFDLENRVLAANPAMCRLLGEREETVHDQRVETLLKKVVGGDEQADFLACVTKRASQVGLQMQWGQRVYLVSLAPVLDDKREIVGTVAAFRDYTHEAEVDRMKSAFVSIASHELRTPLNAIMGYAEMLEEGVYGAMGGRQRTAVERVVVNTGAMLGLVNNLLDRARIEAGTMTLSPSPVLVADLISSVCGVMEVMARAKGLTLASRIAEDMPETIWGDWQRLQQILTNLVDNAIKFTERGGVSILARRHRDSCWALEVRDTGRGIASDAQRYVFDPFQQMTAYSVAEHSGAGLGLSIVWHLVSLMGGEMRLDSTVGEGSTFTAILPLETVTAYAKGPTSMARVC